jgi:FkbM family methyltransferase
MEGENMNTLMTEYRDQQFHFTETPMARDLINEIFSDNYKIFEKEIKFRDGDVVLDVGANEGMFSILIAKLFPGVRVVSLEPVPRTFENFKKNIVLNGLKNIEPYNIGVGKPGQHTIMLTINREDYSGGSSSLITFDKEGHLQVEVGLISLDEAFDLYKIDRCRLLKMDIEGMEYEALYPCTILPRVDYMTAEFHINNRLSFQSRRIDGLAAWCASKTKLIHADLCKMGE